MISLLLSGTTFNRIWLIRAHSALAYCALFCFYTVSYIETRTYRSQRETRRPIATTFCMVIESCCNFYPLTSIYPTHRLNFEGKKTAPKIQHIFIPISRCVPIVLSDDKFPANKRLSVNIGRSYQMTPI